MALEPLPSSLLRLKSKKDSATAVDMFKMVMRFMGDNGLSGIKEVVLGNYIIYKVLYNISYNCVYYIHISRGWLVLN